MYEQQKTDSNNEGLLARSAKATSSAKIQTLKQTTNPLLSGQINFNEFTPKVAGNEFRADDAYGLKGSRAHPFEKQNSNRKLTVKSNIDRHDATAHKRQTML